MASIDSDRLNSALTGKMRATVEHKHHIYYSIYDDDNVKLAVTSMSHGTKRTLGDRVAGLMARQLHLDNASSLVQLANCPLSRENAVAMMKRNQ